MVWDRFQRKCKSLLMQALLIRLYHRHCTLLCFKKRFTFSNVYIIAIKLCIFFRIINVFSSNLFCLFWLCRCKTGSRCNRALFNGYSSRFLWCAKCIEICFRHNFHNGYDKDAINIPGKTFHAATRPAFGLANEPSFLHIDAFSTDYWTRFYSYSRSVSRYLW